MHNEKGAMMYSDGNRIVQQVGERTAGGAYTRYRVIAGIPTEEVGAIHFQYDAIPAIGVIGWTNECLLAVILDRLRSFQAGGFECEENQAAIDGCANALAALESRTAKRRERGVEGQHVK